MGKKVGQVAALSLFFGAISAHAQNSVTLTLTERAGAARVAECVAFGVPLPRAWQLTNAAFLRLRQTTGAGIPAQFEILDRWGAPATNGSAPAKWVLVSFAENLAAGASHSVSLDDGGPGLAPSPALTVDISVAGKITVDTGAAAFEINTGGFNILEQVTISGAPLLSALLPAEAIAYGDMDGTNVAPGGSPDFTPRVTSADVERAGPLYAVVRVRGSILDGGGRAVLDYTARLHFLAGSAQARLDFTVENNHPLMADPDTGQPINDHDQGAANSVYIGELRLRLRLRDTGAALRVLSEQAVDVTAPAATVRLVQCGSGTTNWDSYVGLVGWPGHEASANPRLQSYCPGPGFEIAGAGGTVTGMQALGWMSAFRADAAGPRLTAAMRDFCGNFPKALEVEPEGTMAANLFPDGSRFRHNLRVGEQKTHSVLLDFGLGACAAADSERAALAFNSPLFGAAPPAWYTNALAETAPANLAQWPLYERYVRTAFEPNPDFDSGDSGIPNSTLLDAIARYNFSGWQDYGDVPLDFEAFGPRQAGQFNLKYWFTHAMLVQFCRSADMRWLDLALPAARHLSDTDFLHIPDEGATHWAHGAYYGHSTHDEPGNWNPNRNYNSPSVDLFYGVPDLLLAYRLTGELRFAGVALDGLESMLAMSAFSDFTHPVPQRERANLIFAYIEGYRYTGDARWLQNARSIVGQTADLSNKSWLSNPAAYGVSHPGEAVSTWQLAQVMWTMGRYLDFCAEYGMADDLGVAAALAAYGDFVLNFAMQEYAAGRAAVPFEYYFDGSDPSYLDINAWALTTADALAYAYKYTGRQSFLDAAAKFYATGTTDPAWQDDPPVYTDTKQLVNALVWGLVFMSQAGGGAPEPPTPSPLTPILGFDADGDGCSDLAVFDQNSGLWYIASLTSVQSSVSSIQTSKSPNTDNQKLNTTPPAAESPNTDNRTPITASARVIAWAVPWGWPGALPVPGDYDGDGCSDLAVFDQNSGLWYIASLTSVQSSVSSIQTSKSPNTDNQKLNTTPPAPGTLNTDLSDVVALTKSGHCTLNTGSPRVIAWAVPWGWPGAQPVAGDYDGDGRSDLAVFDSNTGCWYIKPVAGALIAWAEPWGWPGAAPVPGDYDGDGRSDLVVFDSNTGCWYIKPVAGALIAWAEPWGWPGAVPVPGDYDGDSVCDLAVFDANTGHWYIAALSSRFKVQGSRLDIEALNYSASAETPITASARVIAWAEPWGWPGAVPVPGDFDGDGNFDLAVFDGNTGFWYVIKPDGTLIAWAAPWGWPGAMPVGGRY